MTRIEEGPERRTHPILLKPSADLVEKIDKLLVIRNESRSDWMIRNLSDAADRELEDPEIKQVVEKVTALRQGVKEQYPEI